MSQTTSKKVKVKGTQTYINANTGEIEEMQVTSIEDADFNFSKVWMKNFIATLDIVGNQKTKVCFWIIDHIDKNNMLVATQRSLSEQIGVSYQTVSTTIKILLDADFLRKVQSGVYMVNPDVVFKGTRQKRLNVLNQYDSAEYIPLSDEEKLDNLNRSIMELQKQAEAIRSKIDKNRRTDDDGNEYPESLISW